MNFLEKTKKVTSVIDGTIFGISALAMTVITVYSVIMRYIFSSPIIWTEEIQYICIVWCTFFGGSAVFRKCSNIAVDYFYQKMPNKAQTVLNVIIWLVTTLSLGWIVKLEYERVTVMIAKHQTTTILHIPKALGYGGVVIGTILIFINHIVNGVEGIIKFKGGRK